MEPENLVQKLVIQKKSGDVVPPPDDEAFRSELPNLWGLLWDPIRNEHGQVIAGAYLTVSPAAYSWTVRLTHRGLEMAAAAMGKTIMEALKALELGLSTGTIPMEQFRSKVKLKAPKMAPDEIPNQSEGRRRRK
jgi:hypothetical protein